MTQGIESFAFTDPPWPPGYYVIMIPDGVRLADSPEKDTPREVADLIAAQTGRAVVPFTDLVCRDATQRVRDLGFPQISDPLWPFTFQMKHCKGRLVVMKDVSVPVSVSFRGES